MGWSVGWENEYSRFRGYGVPAYCDAKGCRNRINRGLGYGANSGEDTSQLPTLFTCSNHGWADVDPYDLPPEHPEWVNHVLTDESWEQWRSEEPEQVEALKELQN